MMVLPESTSAEAFDQYVSGRLIAASNGWKDLLVRIYSESPVRESTSGRGEKMELHQFSDRAIGIGDIANPARERQRPVRSTTSI
jgi:hypothetical protein